MDQQSLPRGFVRTSSAHGRWPQQRSGHRLVVAPKYKDLLTNKMRLDMHSFWTCGRITLDEYEAWKVWNKKGDDSSRRTKEKVLRTLLHLGILKEE